MSNALDFPLCGDNSIHTIVRHLRSCVSTGFASKLTDFRSFEGEDLTAVNDCIDRRNVLVFSMILALFQLMDDLLGLGMYNSDSDGDDSLRSDLPANFDSAPLQSVSTQNTPSAIFSVPLLSSVAQASSAPVDPLYAHRTGRACVFTTTT